ncbi:MAG: hypothetical protein ACJAV7_001162, partial [Flavobacteriales bacterium]
KKENRAVEMQQAKAPPTTRSSSKVVLIKFILTKKLHPRRRDAARTKATKQRK